MCITSFSPPKLQTSSDLPSDVMDDTNNTKLHPDTQNGGKINVAFNESNATNETKEHVLNLKNAQEIPHYGAVFYTKDASDNEVKIDLSLASSIDFNNGNYVCNINNNEKCQGGASAYPNQLPEYGLTNKVD